MKSEPDAYSFTDLENDPDGFEHWDGVRNYQARNFLQAQKTIADKVYSAAQAERGEARFKTSCTACHSPNSFSGGAFAEKWSGQTLSEVFDFISNAMPENDPGSLKREDYVNVIAFMLKINNLPTGDADLPTDSAGLKNIQIDPK